MNKPIKARSHIPGIGIALILTLLAVPAFAETTTLDAGGSSSVVNWLCHDVDQYGDVSGCAGNNESYTWKNGVRSAALPGATSIAVCDGYLALGQDDVFTSTGETLIYQDTGSGWLLYDTLTGSGDTDVAFSDDCSVLATGTLYGGTTFVYRWDGSTWTTTSSDTVAGYEQVAVSPDGNCVVTSDFVNQKVRYVCSEELEELLPTPTGEGSQFGRGLAVDNNRMVVCAPEAGGAGQCFRYDLESDEFIRDMSWMLSGGVSGEAFGFAAALRDDILVVGAPKFDDDCAGNCNVGRGFVFRDDTVIGEYLGHSEDTPQFGNDVAVDFVGGEIRALFGEHWSSRLVERGGEGRLVALPGDTIFVDGFESGNTSAWSSTTP